MNNKKIERIYCNVCDIFLNSSDQYAMHLLGKQHLRKSQTSEASHIITVGNLINSQASEYNTIMSSYQQPSVMNEWVPTTETSYSQLQVSTIPLPTPSAAPLPESAETSTASQSNEKNENPEQPKEKKGKFQFCPVCFVTLTSKSQAEVHYSGLKHKKTLALRTQSQITGLKRKREEYCEVCNIPLSSSILAEAHYAGAKHEKKMKLVTKVSTGVMPSPVYQTATSNAEVTSSTVTTGNSGSVSAPKQKKELDPETKAQLYCHFCNLAVNSLAQMTAHQNGTKHKQKARQLPSQRNVQYQNIPNMVAPNLTQQQQQQNYQFFRPGSYIPDLKSSFIFGETTQNITY